MNDLRVLIVEDDRMTSELHQLFVRAEPGMQIVGVLGSVRDAEEFLARRPVDLVLLDLDLPDGNGLDLLEAVAVTPAPEIVVLSADRSTSSVVTARQRGVAHYLAKPFSAADLRQRLRSAARARALSAGRARSISQREIDALTLGTTTPPTNPAERTPAGHPSTERIHTGDRFDLLRDQARRRIAEIGHDEACTADAVAAALSVSTRQLQRAFAAAGGTVNDEIRAHRVRLAAMLLLDRRRLSIEQVAESVGFGNAKRLRRAFVDLYDVSPAEWRRRSAHARTPSADVQGPLSDRSPTHPAAENAPAHPNSR